MSDGLFALDLLVAVSHKLFVAWLSFYFFNVSLRIIWLLAQSAFSTGLLNGFLKTQAQRARVCVCVRAPTCVPMQVLGKAGSKEAVGFASRVGHERATFWPQPGPPGLKAQLVLSVLCHL